MRLRHDFDPSGDSPHFSNSDLEVSSATLACRAVCADVTAPSDSRKRDASARYSRANSKLRSSKNSMPIKGASILWNHFRRVIAATLTASPKIA